MRKTGSRGTAAASLRDPGSFFRAEKKILDFFPGLEERLFSRARMEFLDPFQGWKGPSGSLPGQEGTSECLS
jgi:hypothetical protein